MKPPHFELYRDRKNGWRWRVRARNAKIVADCAESYKTRRAAMKGIAVTQSASEVRDAAGNVIVGGLKL